MQAHPLSTEQGTRPRARTAGRGRGSGVVHVPAHAAAVRAAGHYGRVVEGGNSTVVIDLLTALGDVAGTEPTPVTPRARSRGPMPGLGPLAVLRQSVRRCLAHWEAEGLPRDQGVAEVTRLVRHALPSSTPDWSASLLLEAIARWGKEETA
jgi:hypothetical protein